MGSTVGSAAVADEATGPGAGNVVSRPRLFERLTGAARVIVVSAQAGSGKTVLLRSWISQSGLEERAAWVPAGRGERDPQQIWLSVLAALRRTAQGAVLVRGVTAAPDLNGDALVERLLTDLAPLTDRLWLVIDDIHELGSDALRQLELLIMRAPPQLRFVLATRHDLRLGLHRLRLEGAVAEIRGPDLRFTLEEARALFDAAGVQLPELALLLERTEGWAAGLRLAALSLAGHPNPERLAAEFSGTERTVAEYLLAEVLDRQPERVRRLLLHTSILNSVNGELANLLTGGSGGERMLQDLEQANAFVVAQDTARTWFRYHQMFADLLQMELRRTAPDEITGLHQAASAWCARNGHPVEATQHAQAARDWELAADLLTGHWPGLYLEGQAAVIRQLLAAFPAHVRATDPRLAAVAAADELTQGSLEAAERHLGLAERAHAAASSVLATGRLDHVRLLLGVVRLLLSRQRGDLSAVTEQARLLQAMAESPDAAVPMKTVPMKRGEEVGREDLRALALINLGLAELLASQFGQAKHHLEQGTALARDIGRHFLEFAGLAYQAATAIVGSDALATEHGMAAVELARQHGWGDEPAAGAAYIVLAASLAWKGQFDEAETWVQRAERILRAETDPAARLGTHLTRGMLELARGRDAGALAAFQAAEGLADRFAAPIHLLAPARAYKLLALVRLGETERAERTIAELGEQEPGHTEISLATAAIRLAQGDPRAATAELARVFAGPPPVFAANWLAQALTLEAIARDALGEPGAAEDALERALDLAEPEGMVSVFLLHPAPALLERHSRHRTAHAALIADTLSLLAGRALAPPPAGPQPPVEALSSSEIRVLRYLPTNLPVRQIAGELYLSHNTVRTHMKHLYAKLGTHSRADTVARARTLGLLAPSPHQGHAPLPR